MKRNPDERALYALFDSADEMERAFDDLIAAGISVDDISLLMTEETHDRGFKALEKHRTREGAAAGGAVGVTLGGILGGLTVLGATFTGGIGILVVGPVLALAAAGSVVGGLIGHGIPEEETKRLHDALHQGKAMLAVHTHKPGQIATVEGILGRYHGEDVTGDLAR
ncbi:MAG: hypothetical protein IT384_15180 [Deltaproteobacteria bacterium]|nr:hypothetical protein [Deltaproteobacteria bacterium]